MITKTKDTKTKKTTKTKAAAAELSATKPINGAAKLKQGDNRKRKKVVSVSALKGYDKFTAPPVAVVVSQTEENGNGSAEGNGNGNGNGEGELSISHLRRVKSGLSRKELNHYRELLMHKRAELLGDVQSLEFDAQKQGGEGISYEHMADAGSDNFEQEFTLGLVEEERKLLRLINEAIERLNNGTFGICVVRGIPIGKARLDAKPWAKYCIEVAREKDRIGAL